jgi:hypothetical protein
MNNQLLDALRKLKPSGEKGFEGSGQTHLKLTKLNGQKS